MKLFWKIYIAVLISFVAVIAPISYLISARQIFDAQRRIVDEHIVIGSLISNDIERGQAEAKWPFEHLMKLREHTDFLFWWIVEKDGIIHLADKAPFIGTSAYGYFPQLASIKVDGNVALNRKKDCGIFIKSFGTEKNKRTFWLGFSTSDVSRIKRRIIVSTAASSCFALAALGVLLSLMISHFTRPLKNLAESAAIIGMGDLDHRVEVRSEDELGYLANCFNDMTVKLKESYTHLEEKVQQRTAELSSANIKLEEEIAERKLAQVRLQQHIKQLNCLYGLSKLAVRPQISLDQIFQETAKLIRSVYRYPDITCARITFNGIQYKTDNFQRTEISQHADIEVRGEKAGAIEVYCLQEKQESGESPFLKEEAVLLDAVAEQLGRIAELKQATEKLRIFRNLIEQSNESIFVLEPQWGRFLDVNDRACQNLGYSRKELLEMSFKDIEEFPDNFPWQQQLEELKLKGHIIIQGRHKCKDGTRFFAETSLRFVKEDREDYVIAIARDITERKQMEEELRASEHKYKTLLENLPQRIFYKDKNFVYVSCNGNYAHDLGIKPEEIAGKTDYDFYPEDLAEKYRADDKRIMESGKSEDIEEKYIQDGQEIVVYTVKTPVRGEQGNIVGILGIFWDITERKRAEDEIKTLKQQIEFILGATKTGLDIIDSQFNIRYIDPEWQKVYGDPTGKKCYEYFMGGKEVCPGCGVLKALETKDIIVTEEILVKENNRPIQVTTRPFHNERGEWLVAEVNVDITDRKKAEKKQAELLKEVESINRELKDFAYIVSHDLKAPLRGVKTLAEWISTDYADKLDEQGKEQIKLLMGRADRMQKLINGILEYSRVGRVKENRAVTDLNKVVAEVIDMIAPPENITITIENELPTIECEPTRMGQVFQNLLSNAVKYMDKPQGLIKVSSGEENGFWKFAVTDNGPGIEEKHFEKIFQIFQTLAPRDNVESTGVGLTVAKKIVELYGGRIWVQSKVTEGSTFFFTLPKQKHQTRPGEVPGSSQMGVENEKLEANITC